MTRNHMGILSAFLGSGLAMAVLGVSTLPFWACAIIGGAAALVTLIRWRMEAQANE